MKLDFVVTDQECCYKAEYGINYCQDKFQSDKVGKMFWKKELMPGNVPVIVICYSQVKKDIQED